MLSIEDERRNAALKEATARFDEAMKAAPSKDARRYLKRILSGLKSIPDTTFR